MSAAVLTSTDDARLVRSPAGAAGLAPVRPAASGTATAATACAPSYARLAEVFPGLRVNAGDRPPRGRGWVRGDELAAGGAALDALLAAEDAQIRADHGRPARPDVVATFAFHRYAWPACLLLTLPWFLQRRVPHLPADRISYHRAHGRLTVRATGFSCLPDDPAAGVPGAVVVADEEALRAEVRSAVAASLEPVLAGFRPTLRRGPRALWAMVTDEVVEGLWYVGHLLGEEDRAREELRDLLPGTAKPFVGGAAFRTLGTPDGGALPTRDRASCCLYYTLRPEDTCATCPRTCDTDRLARLSAGS